MLYIARLHALFQMSLLVIVIIPIYLVWSVVNAVRMGWFLCDTIDEHRLTEEK